MANHSRVIELVSQVTAALSQEKRKRVPLSSQLCVLMTAISKLLYP
jgi:hypothetical protein